jgi:AraC-like DNA-binding protein
MITQLGWVERAVPVAVGTAPAALRRDWPMVGANRVPAVKAGHLREHLRTSDLDAAQVAIGGVYEPTKIDADPTDGFEIALEAFRLNQVTVGRLMCNEQAHMVTTVNQYHVLLPLWGQVRSRSESGESYISSPQRAAMFVPGRLADTRWPGGTTQLCVMIPSVLIETAVEGLLQRSVRAPVPFDPLLDLGGPHGSGWRDLLWLLQREFHREPGMLSHPLTAGHLEGLLVDGLLLNQRHVYREAMAGADTAVSTRTVRRAMQLVEERPAEPWSTTTLAAEVHASVRSLQEGFKRVTGETPMSYVRNVRLQRVHEELRRACPGEASVQDVAGRWAFTHMGRFSVTYRQRFGETPSETLRRPH